MEWATYEHATDADMRAVLEQIVNMNDTNKHNNSFECIADILEKDY